MNRYKCTYWAMGKLYHGDVNCDSLKWAIYVFKHSPNFERFETSPVKVN